jgi:hypothetical protein
MPHSKTINATNAIAVASMIHFVFARIVRMTMTIHPSGYDQKQSIER